MRYHHKRTGVEADAIDNPAMQVHRARGEAVKQHWHSLLQSTTSRYDLNSTPGLREIGRAEPRPISMAGYGTMTSALFGAATLPAHEPAAFVASLGAMMLSWQPTTTACVESAWVHETMQQGSTDAAQGIAVLAVQRRDLGAVRTGIAQTSAHIGSLHTLLVSLFAEEQRLEAELAATPRRRMA
jgi:hypothetical protein